MSNQRLHVAANNLDVRGLSVGVGGGGGGLTAGARFIAGRNMGVVGGSGGGGSGSGVSSTCSSGSVSPIPIPVIAISPGDESSESEIETEPAKIFHRRVSTKRNVNSSVSILLSRLKINSKSH